MSREYKVKLHLLSRLSDGDFHSGEALGAELGMSRAAVAKHINAIKSWGLDVYSVPRKGYCLAHPMQLLQDDVIQAQAASDIEVIPVIDSTNQYLIDRIGTIKSGHTCIAEYQSQGRGRRGRQWVSPFGTNLYMSMYWCLDAGMAAAMGLSLVIGIAAVEALESLGIEGVKLKWPNDLYYHDKKLAGVLVEMSGQAGGAAHLVIGMGINVGMHGEQDNIDQPWVSLKEVVAGRTIDRNQLAITFINAWYEALKEYEMSGMAPFVGRWNRLDNFLGRKVKLLIGPREITGEVKGIDAQGGVILQTEQGEQTFVGGEISLRKND